MTGLELLPWDTQFFGKQIAKATQASYSAEAFSAMLDTARTTGVECLYLLADSQDLDTIWLSEAAGFHLTDIRVTLDQEIGGRSQTVAEAPINIRPFGRDEVKILAEMTRGSFTDTRFYRDPGFTRTQCDALYQTWIEKSCQGWADLVLVADCQDQPRGYVTGHLGQGDSGRIGLICVDRTARGLGIGEHLIVAALGWFARNGARRVSVSTQGSNIRALQVYQRCGFLITAVELWFHKWFTYG